jgi:hypothetical protein
LNENEKEEYDNDGENIQDDDDAYVEFCYLIAYYRRNYDLFFENY